MRLEVAGYFFSSGKAGYVQYVSIKSQINELKTTHNGYIRSNIMNIGLFQPVYPRVCAHRGFSGACPENTLPAFASAIALGVDEIYQIN